MTESLIAIAAYCAALHILRRVRAYVPPGRVRDGIDKAMRVMGGGGPGVEK